jgi:hypothetical protein
MVVFIVECAITVLYHNETTASGVHLQGPAPIIQFQGTTSASSTSFVLAGLGQGAGTVTLTVTGFFDVTCANPGNNEDVPGQRTSAQGTSGPISFSSDKNGKATVPAVPPTTLVKPTSFPAGTCPNEQWTPTAVGQGTVTGATLVVTFNNQVVYGPISATNPNV